MCEVFYVKRREPRATFIQSKEWKQICQIQEKQSSVIIQKERLTSKISHGNDLYNTEFVYLGDLKLDLFLEAWVAFASVKQLSHF